MAEKLTTNGLVVGLIPDEVEDAKETDTEEKPKKATRKAKEE